MLGSSCRMPLAEDIRPSKAACRCLFGPVDHEELQRDLRREKESIHEMDDDNWNFDFRNVKPRPGRWQWSAVGEDDTSIPQAYELPGLSGKRKRESDEDSDHYSAKSPKLDLCSRPDDAALDVASSPPSSPTSSHDDSEVLEDLPSSPRDRTPSPTSPPCSARQPKITGEFWL